MGNVLEINYIKRYLMG